MDVVGTAASNLEHVAADRVGNHLGILIAQYCAHAHVPDAVILKRSSRHHKAAVDKSIFHALACDFLALGQLISLIDKAVVCRYDKVMGISAAIDAADQIHDLLHGFLTGVEHLILGVGLVATGIDLIVVHVDDLPLGKDIP